MCLQSHHKIHGKPFEKWLELFPVLKDVCQVLPAFWRNPALQPSSQVLTSAEISKDDLDDAVARLQRFAPYLADVFPETAAACGLIESALQAVPAMKAALVCSPPLAESSLFVKLDSHLPISGSIKARGGIYEVLKLAETIAVRVGLLDCQDDYRKLSSPLFKQLFGRYSIVVGSTGNLGLSIGLIGRKLGFNVSVHMSSDGMEWKKKLLRDLGVHVIEHEADYGVAVAEGRREANAKPEAHFVDDEASRDLFLGYAVAGLRLKQQFAEQGITVDKMHPLFVYLPCGVGGGPGGVAFGLKHAFGDNVHCFFGEPTRAPAMLVGLVTGLHDQISASDFGIVNKTAADGLAVSRPSGLVCRMMKHLVSGIFTADDEELYRLLALAARLEDLRLEPSAVIGFSGYRRMQTIITHYCSEKEIDNATHLVWVTGGSMVPDGVWEKYKAIGAQLPDSEL